jgi:hypothetical protein
VNPDHLERALRRTLGHAWEFHCDTARLHIQRRDPAGSYRPPRAVADWPELLHRLEHAFADHSVPRDRPLPLRWGRETEFIVSAVQAADPYLKHRAPHLYREGFIAQPVVRLTGARRPDGRLADGFLTSFVNVSHVCRTSGVADHAARLDAFLGVLGRLGLHARHLTITGEPRTWRRGPVSGITLHIQHAGLPIGDCVLLWNTDAPDHAITDLGSGLERLRWAVGRRDWADTVHGRLACLAAPDTLDAVRTAALAIGSGILPHHRPPGDTVRRLLRAIPHDQASLGVSAVVRAAHRYWTLTAAPLLDWPHITTVIEDARAPEHHPPSGPGPFPATSGMLDHSEAMVDARWSARLRRCP